MNKTILLVEYDSKIISSISDLFSGEGFDFVTTEDGEAAKKALEKQRFDLIITAAMLPKFHGFYLSQHIKENFPDSSVIIISGVFKGYEYRQQAMTQYMADDYFEKPLDLIKLKSRAFELMSISGDAPAFNPTENQIPKAKTNKIPTLKTLEQEQDKLTSDDIFGDILKMVENSNPAVEIDLEPSMEVTVPEPKQTVKTNIMDRQELLKELVPIEEPERVKPSVLLNKSINVDEVMQKSAVADKPKNEYKKLEDQISKKFEETLSGLGLSHKSSVKPSPKPDPAPTISLPTAGPAKPTFTPIHTPQQKPVINTETVEEVGGYEILGPIARGGMAEIYKAKKKGVKGFEKIIALKKILSGYGEDQKYIEMFVDEAKIAAQLSHPNIVQIYDLGRKDDYYFIAMEYIEGKDLRLLLRQLTENESFLPQELAIYLIIKILEALYYAHTAKDNRGQTLDIVHRDVSPPNILIGYNGEIKLTDFGVSKASIKMHQTISGALKGKLLYMSPEQAKGDRNIDCRSDIFSAGVIFFEMLTNKKLFLDESEIQVLKKVQDGEIINPSSIRKDIDPDLEAIVLKSLQKDTKARYQNGSEMVEALSNYLHKNYNQPPTPAHIAHFLVSLFADEIRKNNIKVELKKEPYQITRQKQPTVEKISETVKVPKVEAETKHIPVAPPPRKEVEIKPPPVSVPQKPTITIPAPHVPSIRSDEEFTAMEERPIEIDLGGTGREEPVSPPQATPAQSIPTDSIPAKSTQPKITSSKPQPPLAKKHLEPKSTSYHEELALLDQEKHSKKKIWIISAAVIVVAIGLYIFLFLGNSSTPQNEGIALPQTEAIASNPDLTQTANQPEPNQTEMGPQNSVIPNTSEGDTSPASGTLTISQPQQQLQQPSTQASIRPAITTPPNQQLKPAVSEPVKNKPQPLIPDKKTDPLKPITTTKEPILPEKKPVEKEPLQQPVVITPAEPAPQPEPLKQEPLQTEKPVPVEPEPVKQITEGMLLAITEVDIQPERLSTPPPQISNKILKSLPENTIVLVQVLVNHKGIVEKVKMSKKSNNNEADMAITSILNSWRFKPARKNNLSVKVWLTIPITLK